MEKYYGINLDPRRMLNEPTVVFGKCGRGTVLLSLVHFDKPGDLNGMTVLRNLWRLYRGEGLAERRKRGAIASPESRYIPFVTIRPYLGPLITEVREAVEGLIELGVRNFLWFRRSPFMLQWRRGVRGLEYCTLKVLTDEITRITSAESSQAVKVTSATSAQIERVAASTETQLVRIKEMLLAFIGEARVLLVLERQAMMREGLSFSRELSPH